MKFEILNDFLNIEITEIWNKEFNELPEFIDYANCIYCIENQINLKRYIGQTKWFYGRFEPRNNGSFSHYQGYQWQLEADLGLLLYRAMVKYNPINFKVYLVESNVSDLNEREKYWIKYFHTCVYDDPCWGYNMNWGGSDCSQMHSKLAISHRMETNLRLYGDTRGRLCYPECREKARRTLAARYNGDPYGHIHTSESRRNQTLINIKNHGGVLSTNIPQAIVNRSVTKRFKRFNDYINSIDDINLLTGKKVYNEFYTEHRIRNIIGLFERIPDLIIDYRWNENIKFIFELLYDYCEVKHPLETNNYLMKYYKLL